LQRLGAAFAPIELPVVVASAPSNPPLSLPSSPARPRATPCRKPRHDRDKTAAVTARCAVLKIRTRAAKIQARPADPIRNQLAGMLAKILREDLLYLFRAQTHADAAAFAGRRVPG